MKPQFSIIIPMYNVEKFVARAIQSAVNQSYENIEIICVDDCGADKSVEIAKEFAMQNKRIKIIQNGENLGTFAARNNGAISASGEYLFFLDGDDYLHADTCLKCYKNLQNDAKTQIVGRQIDFIMFNLFKQDEKDEEFKLINVIDKSQIIDDHAFEAMYFGQDAHYYNIATKCIRKDTYLKALNFANVTRKITIAEDILVSMALLGVSKRIALLDCALYYYCYNGDSATRTIESDKIREKNENLNFVMSKFKEFTSKKDEQYVAFIQGMSKVLDIHIAWNKMQISVNAYQRRIKKGYPRWLARLILSLSKKCIKPQTKEKKLYDFIKDNEWHFKDI